MDWIMIVLIMTTAPNYSQSHSHYLVNFTSEKLCADAAAAFENNLGGPSENGFKVKVRAVCTQRKAKGGTKDE
jgi:hypothetical protein